MAALIVRDDSVLSRTAWIIEQRKERIELYNRILRGEEVGGEYYHVNKEAIEKALENEKWLLNDLIEDIEEGLFLQELHHIRDKYVMG